MFWSSEGYLGCHGLKAFAVLARQLAQVVAISGDNRIDEAVPLGLGEGGKIGFADAFEIRATLLAADSHCLHLIRGGIDHARPPVADVLADAAAEVLAAGIAARVR